MNYQYLLDTNILSDLVKHPSGVVARRIAEVGKQQICMRIIVAGELRFGVEKSDSIRLAHSLEQILAAMEILPLEIPCENSYAKIRTHLEQAGTPIGANDLLIAAQALMLNLSVVTANERKFSRVPGLTVENWLKPI